MPDFTLFARGRIRSKGDTWEDNRDGDANIYGQRFFSTGTALGANFEVNDDAGSARQFNPAVAYDGTGDFAVAWMDERDLPQGICAQRYAGDGTPQGVNFEVTEDNGTTSPNAPAGAI